MGAGVDRELLRLVGGVLGVLVVASVVGALLSRLVTGDAGRATVANINARIRAWWVMCGAFALTLLTRGTGWILLFAAISLLALREFLALVPTPPEDRATIWAIVLLVTVVQYALVWADWYGLFVICIPVYAFLLIPTYNALRGRTERFLERTADIQWALVICVYAISYAPALLRLRLRGYAGQNAKLLVFFVLVVQGSDVLQYIWGKLVGRHHIAPQVSPNKTWEGFLAGVACATLVGAGLWWATPFSPWQAAAMALVAALMGFAGGLTMSAIKRDRGIKDFGALIGGHGGMLDRVDSICFAAPVFFHLARFFFGV